MQRTILIAGALLAAHAATGGDWMQWRGPALNGTCDAKNLPVSWSVADHRNVAWACELPGAGSSTPIVVANRIFLTAETDDHRLYAFGIDRGSGKIAWRREMGTGRKAMRSNTMASPSAVSDGKLVWFLFGQGTLAATTLEGKPVWQRELEQDHGTLAQKFGFSASPLLLDGRLYIPLLYLSKGQRQDPDPGTCLLCIDAATGKTVWSADRPSPAVKESRDSYTTPLMNKEGIILTGADLVTCHDPETGREKWRFDFEPDRRKPDWRIISGPVMAGDLVATPYPRGKRMVALGSGGKTVWEYEGQVPDVCTSAFADGLLYVLDGEGRYLTCFDAPSGKVVWQQALDGEKGFHASPLVADGKIYMMDLGGDVFVYAAGRQTKQLAHFAMGGENCTASIIAVDDALFVRAANTLVCARARK